MSIFSRLRSLLKIDRVDREIAEEFESHVAMRTADNVAAGMTPQQARYDAQRRFGNTLRVQEETRAMDLIGWLETCGQNLRYAWRMLLNAPGFTVVAILTLALGIGANIAIFTVVHAILLRPLPYPHPEQLVRVYDDLRSSNTPDVGMSVPELWDLRDKSGVFQDLSVVYPADANLTGGEHPERIQLLGTGASYFTMLAARPQIGRVYTAADQLPGFSEPVVISDAFWHRTFGGDPGVIGKKILVDSDVYVVAGVMPPDFRHPGRALGSDVDLWATAGLAAPPFPVRPIRSARFLPGAIGRLRPGISVAQAQKQLDNFAGELSREFPNDYPAGARWAVRLVPIQQDLVGKVETELYVLFAAVALVLLIACVNLANLLLARSASRHREIAIRVAIGAGKTRLLGQMLTESVLLSTLSGAAALATVFSLKSSLLRLAPANLPRLSEVRLSPGVLLFTFVISIATGVVFGLAPAWRASRVGQIAALREGSQGTGASREQLRFSRWLVASEIALSLVLLIGAGLLLRSFWQLLEVSPGFDARRLTTAKIWLPVPNDPKEDHYAAPEKRAAFHREVLGRISALAGVESAALGNGASLPMDDNTTRLTFVIENRVPEAEQTPVAQVASVSPEYFPVLRTPLVGGRFFTDSDNTKGQLVVLIDEALAHRYWPGAEADAVGKRIQFSAGRAAAAGGSNPWLTIVGVVGNIKTEGFAAAGAPHIYRSEYQFPTYDVVAFLRTSIDPGTLGDLVRKEVQNVDPGIPVFAARSMRAIEAQFLAERRFSLELLGIFALVALVLAVIGIYGVMAYTFSRRTNEIGIRMAMGAKRRDIVRLALGEGASSVALGVVAGLLGSLVLTQFLRSMLFSVKPSDPLTFATIAALLAVATLFACLLPALRASRVDPLIALRHE